MNERTSATSAPTFVLSTDIFFEGKCLASKGEGVRICQKGSPLIVETMDGRTSFPVEPQEIGFHEFGDSSCDPGNCCTCGGAELGHNEVLTALLAGEVNRAEVAARACGWAEDDLNSVLLTIAEIDRF